MKIIAIIYPDSKFLVEISQTELNKVTGKTCGHYSSSEVYRVGQNLDIIKTWEYLEPLLKKKDELLKISRNLRSMADMIESIPMPTQETLTEIIPETLSND